MQGAFNCAQLGHATKVNVTYPGEPLQRSHELASGTNPQVRQFLAPLGAQAQTHLRRRVDEDECFEDSLHPFGTRLQIFSTRFVTRFVCPPELANGFSDVAVRQLP